MFLKLKKTHFKKKEEKTRFFIVFNYKMTTRQSNIKNRTYYFYNDLINVLNFEASNLKLDKKTWKDIDIYYVGYVDKNPNGNVNSVNPLYLTINRVYGIVSEKNGVRFLTIEDAVLKKCDQVFSGIKYHIGKIDDKKSFMIVTITKLVMIHFL